MRSSSIQAGTVQSSADQDPVPRMPLSRRIQFEIQNKVFFQKKVFGFRYKAVLPFGHMLLSVLSFVGLEGTKCKRQNTKCKMCVNSRLGWFLVCKCKAAFGQNLGLSVYLEPTLGV